MKKIEFSEEERNALNFFYGFLTAHRDRIKEETDLDSVVKTALSNNLKYLESLLRKLNYND